MNRFVVNNPLRKAINLEKTRKRINSEIANNMNKLEREKKFIQNNPGQLPNVLSAAQRKMVFYNDEISRLKRQKNTLYGGRKKTRRNKK